MCGSCSTAAREEWAIASEAISSNSPARTCAACRRICRTKILAYFTEGTKYFNDYVEAVKLGPGLRARNRRIMMDNIISAMRHSGELPPFTASCRRSTATTTTLSARSTTARTCYHTQGRCPRRDAANSASSLEAWERDRTSSRAREPGKLRELQPRSGPRHVSRGEAKRRFTVQDHSA